MPFDARPNAYALQTPALAGTYRLDIDSTAAGAKRLELPVVVLAQPPELTLVRDGLGHDATAFAALQTSAPIRLEWQATTGASRYLVEARQAGVTLLSQTVTETSLVLPAALFSASATGLPATVQVTATHQTGDLRYQSAPYVSTSSLAGSSFTFQVVP